MSGAIPPLPNTSWGGAQLKRKAQGHLYRAVTGLLCLYVICVSAPYTDIVSTDQELICSMLKCVLLENKYYNRHTNRIGEDNIKSSLCFN
jgi:hypothetical protein